MKPDSFRTESSRKMKVPKALSRKGIAVVVAGVLAVVGTGLIAYRYVNNANKVAQNTNNINYGEPNPASGNAQDPPIYTPSKPTGEYAITIADSDKLVAASDRQGAVKLLESFMPKAKGPEQEFGIASRISFAYFGMENWAQAISWGERAQKTGQAGASSLNLTIAISAEKTGDKPKAIAAYRAVIDAMKNEKGTYFENQRKQYQDKIKALGG